MLIRTDESAYIFKLCLKLNKREILGLVLFTGSIFFAWPVTISESGSFSTETAESIRL